MATTDTRTGFRLPWSTDRSASREASAEPVEELASGASTTELDDGAAIAQDPGNTGPQDAKPNGVLDQEDDAVTILAPDSGPVLAHADPPAPAYEHAAAPDPGPAEASPFAPPSEPRRPTQFLAELTRAMQAAAEQARAATLEQFRADGTAAIEQIHSRSAAGATELRRHADDDVATIKDWSKAEIARIREETERRVTTRREQLEGQLERHAAIVEHEVEKVRGRLAAFETEMGLFFDSLAGEDDPGVFAARAANLPEPPKFDGPDDEAMTALLREPGLGVPGTVVEEAVQAVAAVTAEPEPSDVSPPVPEAFHAETEVAEPTPVDADAAMAAIQAAAEAAAALETSSTAEAVAEPIAEVFAEPVAEQIAEAVAEPVAEPVAEAVAEAVAEWTHDPSSEAVADDAPAADPAGPEVEAEFAEAPVPHAVELDPRLAMLGLTPDFAAAEVAAVEMAAADVDEVPQIAGDALEARLSGLVPAEETADGETPVTTQVVVTGLVSVASIASFKRHLGRLPGVGHVGVSSGPDAEFVFAVTHEPATPLRDLIPTLPGFAARIAATSDGVIQVSAQDPQD